MRLRKDEVKNFQRMFRENYGMEITYKEAEEAGLGLIRLFEETYKGIKKSDLSKLNNYQNKDVKKYENDNNQGVSK